MASKCMMCGQEKMELCRGDFHFDPPPNIPGGKIVIKNTQWRQCKHCGETIIPHALDKALDNESRKRRGLLTPDEIRDVRACTGLNQEEMAQLLGVGDKTYTRWESGRSIQNKSSDNLIRLVHQNTGLFTQLEAERNIDRQTLIAEYINNLHQLKGTNQQAYAAHGGELEPSVGKKLQQRLREIAQSHIEDKH